MAQKQPQHDQPQVGCTSTSTMNAKMKSKRSKTKLDFNAPLLSTRPRLMCRSSSSRTSRSYTAERIPFCWEQVPGKPKEMHQTTTDDHQLPPPKPPPGRWHPSSSTPFDLTHTTTDNCIIQLSDGFDADIDDHDENGMFSDAMDDMFSLSEAIDFVEKEAEKAQSQRGHGLDGFDARTAVSSDCEDYPSFIIQRFLPAATALAAASSVVNNKKQMMNGSGFSDDDEGLKMNANTASGCGLEKLFTWRIKHKPCSIRSPVCQSQSSSVNLKCHQQLRGKKMRPDGFKGSKR